MAKKKTPDEKPKDEKAVYVTLIKNGDIVQKAFSYNDAEKAGILASKAYGLIDSDELEPIRLPGITCESDQYTQRDFEKTGRLGCPDCYVTFRDFVQPLLERMHKGTRHLGKIPEYFDGRELLIAKVDHLRQKMNSAVTTERYEDAAQLRDDIKVIEKKLN